MQFQCEWLFIFINVSGEGFWLLRCKIEYMSLDVRKIEYMFLDVPIDDGLNAI
jgi:hypothetical protein